MKKLMLTPEQAFDAMFVFLDAYWKRTGGAGELGAILGDIQINLADGRPMDPAAWNNWTAAVDRVLRADVASRKPGAAAQ
jgi:hypothetical protein